MRDYAKLRGQDADDGRWLARRISAALHHCAETPQCTDPTACRLCANAARLAVQEYRGVIERRVVASLMSAYDVQCDRPHPGGD